MRKKPSVARGPKLFLDRGLLGEEVQQVIDLHAETLAARDLDEWLCLGRVLSLRVSELTRRLVRQRDHFV